LMVARMARGGGLVRSRVLAHDGSGEGCRAGPKPGGRADETDARSGQAGGEQEVVGERNRLWKSGP